MGRMDGVVARVRQGRTLWLNLSREWPAVPVAAGPLSVANDDLHSTILQSASTGAVVCDGCGLTHS